MIKDCSIKLQSKMHLPNYVKPRLYYLNMPLKYLNIKDVSSKCWGRKCVVGQHMRCWSVYALLVRKTNSRRRGSVLPEW